MSIAESIQGFWLKCKNAGNDVLREWGLILVIFLAIFGSFGLGRLSVGKADGKGISIEKASEAEALGMAIGGLVIASKGGNVYHFPWCAGAEQISPQNKVWFSSEKAAQNAGYKPAGNCKGLINSGP